MQETRLSIEDVRTPASTAGSARLPYLCPEVEVQHVELEGAIAASATANPTPGITDPTDGGQQSGDINF